MTEEATFYREAWRRFLDVPRVRRALADPAFDNWTPDRRYLSILVDVSDVAPLAATAAEVAAAVVHPAFGLVGADGLYLTLQEIGFADDEKLDPAAIMTIEQDLAR